jgi:hypothetical protein
MRRANWSNGPFFPVGAAGIEFLAGSELVAEYYARIGERFLASLEPDKRG